jgi:hypothetical protein
VQRERNAGSEKEQRSLGKMNERGHEPEKRRGKEKST